MSADCVLVCRFRPRLQGSAETAAHAADTPCPTSRAWAATAGPDDRGRRDYGTGDGRARMGLYAPGTPCGGRVLAASDPRRPIQPADVRDLAAFILRAAERGLSRAMNVTAPVGHSAYGEMLAACRDVTGGAAELAWVDDEWLSGQDVTPWTEIPLWRTAAGAWNVSSARAEAAGLSCRPLRGTVADTWAWMQQEEPMPHERADEIGIDPVKEQRLLDAWSHRSGAGREHSGS